MVVVKRTQHRGSLEFVEFGQFLISTRGIAAVGHVQARQWPDTVDPIRVSRRQIVRRLEIGPRFDLLSNELQIVGRVQAVRHDVSSSADYTDPPVIKGKAAILLNDAEKQCREVSEARDLLTEFLDDALEPFERALGDGEHFGNTRQDRIPIQLRQRLAHATGNHPCRMNALPAQPLNDLLPKLAEPDAVVRQLALLLE